MAGMEASLPQVQTLMTRARHGEADESCKMAGEVTLGGLR